MTNFSENGIIIALVLPLIAAIIAPIIMRLTRPNMAAVILALLPLTAFIIFTGYINDIYQGITYDYSLSWVPSYNIELSFYLDGFSLLFALLITGIGTLIIIYAGDYLKENRHISRFMVFILLFMFSMLGVVIADHILSFFIFWEMTSITSFLLIGFEYNRSSARRAALQALIVTGGGGLALLAGLLLIAMISGSYNLSDITASGDIIRSSTLYGTIFWLIIIGAFTKSAQFPFHFWLPNAMEAPTPVSAYLHSATMVKAGVYLLYRLNPVLSQTDLWHTVLPVIGAITLILGMILAVSSTKLKSILAYTTVASLGMMVMVLGIGNRGLIYGGLAYLFAHSLFKGALFMIAGCIDKQTGVKDIYKLGKLATAMPVTTAAAILACASMAGIPFTFGFVAKELIYLWLNNDGGDKFPIALFVIFIANVMMFAIALEFVLKPFFGSARQTPKPAKEPSLLLSGGAVILAIKGILAFGLAGMIGATFITPAFYGVTTTMMPIELHSGIEFNPAFIMSLATILFGIVLYWQIDNMRLLVKLALNKIKWSFDKGFDQFVRFIVRISYHITMPLHTNSLNNYLLITFVMLAAAVLLPVFKFGFYPDFSSLDFNTISNSVNNLRVYDWPMIGLTILGLVAVIVAKTRLTAIVSMGAQGFALALLFLLLGAPDLSFTQFMVETLSVIILALVLTRLRLDVVDARETKSIIISSVLAITIGTGFACLLSVITSYRLDQKLAEFFIDNSYPLAHGHNIVNVILVDFRAIDTFGEITVVFIAGVSIFALMNLTKRRKDI